MSAWVLIVWLVLPGGTLEVQRTETFADERRCWEAMTGVATTMPEGVSWIANCRPQQPGAL